MRLLPIRTAGAIVMGITNQLLYQLSYAGNPLESVTYEVTRVSASRSARHCWRSGC